MSVTRTAKTQEDLEFALKTAIDNYQKQDKKKSGSGDEENSKRYSDILQPLKVAYIKYKNAHSYVEPTTDALLALAQKEAVEMADALYDLALHEMNLWRHKRNKNAEDAIEKVSELEEILKFLLDNAANLYRQDEDVSGPEQEENYRQTKKVLRENLRELRATLEKAEVSEEEEEKEQKRAKPTPTRTRYREENDKEEKEEKRAGKREENDEEENDKEENDKEENDKEEFEVGAGARVAPKKREKEKKPSAEVERKGIFTGAELAEKLHDFNPEVDSQYLECKERMTDGDYSGFTHLQIAASLPEGADASFVAQAIIRKEKADRKDGSQNSVCAFDTVKGGTYDGHTIAGFGVNNPDVFEGILGELDADDKVKFCNHANVRGYLKGTTPLMFAAYHGRADLCRRLLKEGAKFITRLPGVEAFPEEFKARRINAHWSALHFAIDECDAKLDSTERPKHLEVVKLLANHINTLENTEEVQSYKYNIYTFMLHNERWDLLDVVSKYMPLTKQQLKDFEGDFRRQLDQASENPDGEAALKKILSPATAAREKKIEKREREVSSEEGESSKKKGRQTRTAAVAAALPSSSLATLPRRARVKHKDTPKATPKRKPDETASEEAPLKVRKVLKDEKASNKEAPKVSRSLDKQKKRKEKDSSLVGLSSPQLELMSSGDVGKAMVTGVAASTFRPAILLPSISGPTNTPSPTEGWRAFTAVAAEARPLPLPELAPLLPPPALAVVPTPSLSQASSTSSSAIAVGSATSSSLFSTSSSFSSSSSSSSTPISSSRSSLTSSSARILPVASKAIRTTSLTTSSSSSASSSAAASMSLDALIQPPAIPKNTPEPESELDKAKKIAAEIKTAFFEMGRSLTQLQKDLLNYKNDGSIVPKFEELIRSISGKATKVTLPRVTNKSLSALDKEQNALHDKLQTYHTYFTGYPADLSKIKTMLIGRGFGCVQDAQLSIADLIKKMGRPAEKKPTVTTATAMPTYSSTPDVSGGGGGPGAVLDDPFGLTPAPRQLASSSPSSYRAAMSSTGRTVPSPSTFGGSFYGSSPSSSARVRVAPPVGTSSLPRTPSTPPSPQTPRDGYGNPTGPTPPNHRKGR